MCNVTVCVVFACIPIPIHIPIIPFPHSQFLIPESIGLDDPLGVATLTVKRERNFVGVVTLYWEVSEDGRLDLEPVSGNLTFAEVSSHLSARTDHSSVSYMYIIATSREPSVSPLVI